MVYILAQAQLVVLLKVLLVQRICKGYDDLISTQIFLSPHRHLILHMDELVVDFLNRLLHFLGFV